MRLTPIITPPLGAIAPPMSPVPEPRGMIGTPRLRHRRTTPATSAADRGSTTRSGMPL